MTDKELNGALEQFVAAMYARAGMALVRLNDSLIAQLGEVEDPKLVEAEKLIHASFSEWRTRNLQKPSDQPPAQGKRMEGFHQSDFFPTA